MAERRYAWRGIDREGQTQQGELLAPDQAQVTAWLREQRIRATHIHRQFALPTWLQRYSQPHASVHDVTRFTRQLATLLHAGVPLLQAFDIVKRGEHNLVMHRIIQAVQTRVEGGESLHHALREHTAFDALYCNLVATGELAGMLDVVLTRLAQHLEKSQALRATLRTALVYPCAVVGIAVAVLSLILLFVVPAFQNIFASFDAELPWLTQVVIRLSQLLAQHGVWLLALLVLSSVWLKQQIQQRMHWRRHMHRLLLRLPIAGPLTQHACTAQWTRTLSTLFAAGVPLTEALQAVQGVTGHMLFQSATHTIHNQLVQGRSLSWALENTQGLFPTMVSQMCAIGEESGTLDYMLEKTAEHYEREVDHTVARLSTLLEPVIMVVLGLLIGGLVMALYLPIFQLGQVV